MTQMAVIKNIKGKGKKGTRQYNFRVSVWGSIGGVPPPIGGVNNSLVPGVYTQVGTGVLPQWMHDSP